VLTLPGGFTSRVLQLNGPGISVLAGDATQAGLGATGNKTGTSSITLTTGGLLLAIPGASAQPVIPTLTRPGVHPRWGSRQRAGRQFAPVLGQASQGTQFPLFTRQGGIHPRWNPYIRRGRVFVPIRPQANQGIAFPLFTRQPGIHPRWAPYIRRGRIRDPIRAQATQGIHFPLFTRGQPGVHPRFGPKLRRGQVFMHRLQQFGVGSPWNLFVRQQQRPPKWAPPPRVTRSRTFAPPWPQGPQAVPFPLFTRQPSGRRWAKRWRPSLRISQFLYTRSTAHASAPLAAAGTMTVHGIVTRRATAVFSATGTMRALPVLTRRGSASLAAAGKMKVTATTPRVAAAHFTAAGTMHAPAVLTRHAAASWTAAGTMTATATDTPGARLSASGTMIAAASVVEAASAQLSAAGTLLASADVQPPVQQIVIEPNAVAPWAEVVETGSYQDIAPPAGPSVVTVEEIGESDDLG
jgi:hypothetical protein